MILPRKVKIGSLLLEAGLISEQQLDTVLSIQAEKGGKIGDLLIKEGYIDEANFLSALSNQMHLPLIELDHYTIKPDIIQQLPEKIARRHKVILLDIIGNEYLIGITDPTDVAAYDEISKLLSKNLRIAIVKERDLFKVFDQVYRRTDDIASFAEALKEELTDSQAPISQEEETSATSAPVVKLLESIFEDAIQVHASDVHIEPDEKFLRIRQRVDGVLQEEIIEGRKIADALVVRIKLMARLNISEKRIPQDGRFHLKIKNHELDVRVSTMPVRFGESIVMRLLDQTGGILSLDDIGMDGYVLSRLKHHVSRPNGLILLTGPTGSGKSTTLYSAINSLNDATKKIITIEDPVEYTLPRISQVQVNSAIGLTFASVLRAALRQDPEVVMIGEMRDEETAKIGLRAAMTGHLVFSTLHTNDSISSAMRLIDMGAEGYLVAAALRMILAQRLVRRNCTNCLVDITATMDELKLLQTILGARKIDLKFKHGSGCPQCNNTGYQGRIGVHEILEIDNELAGALREENTQEFATKALLQKNFKTLAMAALELAISGVTSIEEVIKIANEL